MCQEGLFWCWLNNYTSVVTNNASVVATVVSALAAVVTAVVTWFYTYYTRKLLDSQNKLLQIQNVPNLALSSDPWGWMILANLSASTVLIKKLEIHDNLSGNWNRGECARYVNNPDIWGYSQIESEKIEQYLIPSGESVRVCYAKTAERLTPHGPALKHDLGKKIRIAFVYANTGNKLHPLELDSSQT
jgi:hypothetical protein